MQKEEEENLAYNAVRRVAMNDSFTNYALLLVLQKFGFTHA